MIQIENSFFDLANSTERNCLVICDRGAMDASAFISRDQWENILARNGLDEVEVRDNRYSQVKTYTMIKVTTKGASTNYVYKTRWVGYGNTGCGVFKRGVQN